MKFGFGLVLQLLLSLACGQEPAPSLFDPNAPSKPAPVILSIIPPDSALAGVGEIIIQGDNFSQKKEENLVFFDGTLAEVLQASRTELEVRTPNIVGDSINIKIAVHGAELFSEPVLYKLVPAVTVFGSLLEDEVAFGIATDLDGNVYVSIEGKLIKKISAVGKTSIYARTTFLKANGMKMGPANTLYAAVAAGRARKIATISPDGVESVFVPVPGKPQDLDFDPAGNIWVAVNSDVYIVTTDKSLSKVDSYPVPLKTLRVYENHLYVAGRDDATLEQKIWRSEIQGEQLGPKEVVLDAETSEWPDGATILSITFSEDGDMYLGTDHQTDAMFVLHPDGSHELLYPGLVGPTIYALSWADGPFLFAVQQSNSSSKILRINLRKKGAPYYGRR